MMLITDIEQSPLPVWLTLFLGTGAAIWLGLRVAGSDLDCLD